MTDDNKNDQYRMFEYILPANEPLYKGTSSNNFDINYTEPCWFSKSIHVARGYGGYVHEVRPKEQLRLINITSPFFHTFLQDHVNDYFRNTDLYASYHEKMQLLIPLGLPDEKTQVPYVTKMYGEQAKYDNDVQLASSFFRNLHRYSNFDLDRKLINLIKNLLWQHGFVGYIAPCKWVTCFHNQFHDEICLFDLSRIEAIYFTFKQPQKGGGSALQNPYDTEHLEKMLDVNKINKEIYALYGWYGPYDYDERGRIILWNVDYTKAMVRKKRYEEDTKQPYPEDIEKYKYNPGGTIKVHTTSSYKLVKLDKQ
jgi:hypothetical protein